MGTFRRLLILLCISPLLANGDPRIASSAQWIWNAEVTSSATNKFTYFRRKFSLNNPDTRAAVWLAADAQAQLYVNGHPVARKVTRFTVDHVRPERLLIGPWLRSGANELLVLHHSWGAIKNFQREKRRQAGLWLRGDPATGLLDVNTDNRWESAAAPQFIPHLQQIVGVTGDLRIRFPVIIDGARMPGTELPWDSLRWARAKLIANPIWKIQTGTDETPQREYFFAAQRAIAAGSSNLAWPGVPRANGESVKLDMATKTYEAAYVPDAKFTQEANNFVLGEPLVISGNPGQTRYITFDFHQPVHGYPNLGLLTATRGVAVTLTYGELASSPADGSHLLDAHTGQVSPEAIVGRHYFDQYFTSGSKGDQRFEFPDERTGRYVLMSVTFPADAKPNSKVTLNRFGFVKSQYPVDWAGSFDGGNPRLDQIVALAKVHAEVTMSDAYVDTPGREDGVWLEDIEPRTRIADTWMDDASEARRRVLMLAEESRVPDGRFLAFGPQSFIDITQWDWGARWITMLLDEWRWSGDRAFLKARFPALKTYVALLKAQTDAEDLFHSDQVFADIRIGKHAKSAQDVSAIMQANYIRALKDGAELAEAFGDASDASEWRVDAQHATTAFRNQLIVRKPFIFAADLLDGKTGQLSGRSQAAQLAAFEADVFSSTEARTIIENMFPAPNGIAPEGVDPWNNPTYSERSLTQLTRYGFGERALAHLIRRYGYYLPFSPSNPTELGAQGPLGGPLPEYLITSQEVGHSSEATQPVDPTGSHGWAAVPLIWLHRSVLGVTWSFGDDGSPGGRVNIEPKDCGLPYITGNVRTPKGAIFESWDRARGILTVELPEGVDVNVVLPVSGGWTVTKSPRGSTVNRRTAQAFEVRGAGRYSFAL